MAENDMVPLMVKRSQLAKVRKALARALRPVTGPGVHDDNEALYIGGHNRRRGRLKSHRPTRMRVKTIAANYWACVLWDGTTEGTETHYVALPPDLRDDLADWQISAPTLTSLTRVDAQTLTAAFSDKDDETWKITRTVGIDQEIWPMRVSGGTGVDDPNGDPCLWLLLSGSHAFAKDDT